MKRTKIFETDEAVIARKVNKYLKENFGYTIRGNMKSLKAAKKALVEKKRAMTPNLANAKYAETVMMLEGINKMLKVKIDEDCGKRHKTNENAPKVEQPKQKYGNTYEGQEEYKVNNKKLSENLMKQLNVLLEGDAAEAEVTMAARGIVDALQDIIEKLGKIQNDQLGPLGDEMAFTHGSESADQFKQSSSSSIDTLLQAARSTKDEMNNAVLVLAGQADPMSDVDDDMELGAGDMDADMGDDVAMDMGDDMGDDMGAAPTDDMPLGREKR